MQLQIFTSIQQHPHPMIAPSQSTDSQLDVESYLNKNRNEILYQTTASATIVSSSASTKTSSVSHSFFRRTNPPLNDSSESSSSQELENLRSSPRINRSKDIFRFPLTTSSARHETLERDFWIQRSNAFDDDDDDDDDDEVPACDVIIRGITE
jgi:hypothetical protein